MRWLWLVVVGAACGRIGFGLGTDNSSDAGGGTDGPTSGETPGPSCFGLPAYCGPAGQAVLCGSAVRTGGTFFRLNDAGSDAMYTSTAYPATVRDFRLDTYQVTVGRFRMFVNAGKGTQADPPAPGAGAHPWISGSGWNAAWNTSLTADTAALVAAVKCDATYQTWTDAPSANDNLPINCVTWPEALAFCAWDG